MIWESARRLTAAQTIAFDEALWVAAAGLVVNLLSALILGGNRHDGQHDGQHGHHHGPADHHHDHNLQAAYLHVLADAFTSVLAIVALLMGKHLGWWWMDPVMGLVGATVIANWAWGLLKRTGAVLLDHSGDKELRQEVRAAIEGNESGSDLSHGALARRDRVISFSSMSSGASANRVRAMTDRPSATPRTSCC
jgi:cation diffusion facilitator family transporter